MTLTKRLRRRLSDFRRAPKLRRQYSINPLSQLRYFAEPLEDRVLLNVSMSIDPQFDTGPSSSDGITNVLDPGFDAGLTGFSAAIDIYVDVMDSAHKQATFFLTQTFKTSTVFPGKNLSTGPHTIIFDGDEVTLTKITVHHHFEFNVGIYPTLQFSGGLTFNTSPAPNSGWFH